MELPSPHLFVFFCYGDLRALHSFPTRRSSDLRTGRRGALVDAGPRVPRWRGRRGVVADVRSRSEEHTSELQSHSDLVCRLLLEKKKKKFQALQKDKLRTPTRPGYKISPHRSPS